VLLAWALLLFASVLFLTRGVSAQSPVDASALSRVLSVFDQHGSGDRDGRVELPDLNPDILALRLHEPRAEDRAVLWTALKELCAALAPAECPALPELVTPSNVRNILRALGRAHPHLVAGERLNGVGAIRSDSLRGIHDGADPPANRPWLWSHLVLNGLGVQLADRSQLGVAAGFPVDPDQVAQWFPGYFSLLGDELDDLFVGVAPLLSGAASADVSVRGRTSATLHEAITTPRRLHAEGFEGPGMLFLSQEPHTPDESLIESAVRHIRDRLARTNEPRSDSFLVVTFGANDLFSYRQVALSAPEVEVGQFEDDLRTLDASTSELVREGVRRVYVVPPPVDFVFAPHRVPAGARFTDGSPVPQGSAVLHHWWLAAHQGRRLPRKVVLSSSQVDALRDRHEAFRAAALKILGVDSNWLVVDTTPEFRAMIARAYSASGIVIDGVRGYGKVVYSGTPAVLSTDNVHPTPFGYLAWSEMVLEELRGAGVLLGSDEPLPPGSAPTTEEQLATVMHRVSLAVRASPSFFRPQRYPFDPERPEELRQIARFFEKLDPSTQAGFDEGVRRARFIWPFVPDYLLTRFAQRAGIPPSPTPIQHYELVGIITAVLDEPDARWTAERRRALRDLVLDFVADGELSTMRHARGARAAFGALGRVSDSSDIRRGHTPGPLSEPKTLSISAEAATLTGSRASDWPLLLRAGADFAAYRTPLGYLPLGLTDYTRVEVHLGLDAAWFVAGETPAPVTVEPTVRPLSFVAYADAVPGLALRLDLPAWQPLFAVGNGCAAFSHDCTALARFGMAFVAAWDPFRDVAFDAGSATGIAFHVAVRGFYTAEDRALPQAGALLELAGGLSVTF
jgi:hypothetical protein